MGKLILVIAVTLALAAPAGAQDVLYRFEQRGDAPAQGGYFNVPVPPEIAGDLLEHRMGLMAVEPFDAGNPKTGAPYSADIVTDVVQTLADGNRIEHHTTSSVARDSQGRERREQQLAAIGPIVPHGDGRVVTIMNPVDGVHYSLDPVRKVAMRSQIPVFTLPQGGVARTQVFIGRGAGVGAAGGVIKTEVDTIVANRVTGIDPAAKTTIRDQGRTESLGTSIIEGVQAEGTRTVMTIPAGAIGNQAPIEMVSERWFSSELGVVVMSRRSDPRFGETTYRLQNIVRAEPSAELFEIPADYTIESLPAFGAEHHFTYPATGPVKSGGQ